MKGRRFTSKAGKAPGNRLLPDHFQTALPMLPPDWAESLCIILPNRQTATFEVLLTRLLLHRPYFSGNFHFNFLQRAIEIWEITSDVNKKDTPRFAGKIFVSTDQRYRKIVACLLVCRISFLSFLQVIESFLALFAFIFV